MEKIINDPIVISFVMNEKQEAFPNVIKIKGSKIKNNNKNLITATKKTKKLLVFSGFKDYLEYIKCKKPSLSSRLNQCFKTLRLCFNCRRVLNFDTFTEQKRTIEESSEKWITPNVKVYCKKCSVPLTLANQYHYNNKLIEFEKVLTESGKKKRKCSLCGEKIHFYYYDGILLGSFLSRYNSVKDKFKIEKIVEYWNDTTRDICCCQCLYQNEMIHKLRSEFRFCINCEKTIQFERYFNLQLYLGETIDSVIEQWKEKDTIFLCNNCI